MYCYLCRKNKIQVVRRKVRYGIRRNVLKCNSCGLVFLQPKRIIPDKFYNNDYRRYYTPLIGKSCNPKKIFDIYISLQRERIKRFRYLFGPKSRILEIGCSTGYFLYSLKRYVKECTGIEINVKEADFARKKCKIKIFSVPLEETGLPLEYFDVIFLFETLEHLSDPLKVLINARNYLKPNGHICIQVPNLNDALLSLYKIKSYEDFYYRQPHLFYFSSRTLLRLTKEAGFVGKITTFQQYNFMNHLNWVFIKKPMSSILEGVGRPVLINNISLNNKIRQAFNNWIANVDRGYKSLLHRYVLTESIVFTGGKIEEF